MKEREKPTGVSEPLIIDGFITRPATSEDIQAMVLLEDQAMAVSRGKAIPTDIVSDNEVTRLNNEINKSTTWSQLVYEDDKLVGYTLCYPGKHPETHEVVPGREHVELTYGSSRLLASRHSRESCTGLVI